MPKTHSFKKSVHRRTQSGLSGANLPLQVNCENDQSGGMTILDQLDALREQFPDCLAVAYADISSGIVLCVSAREKHPQEHLDSLCTTAADLFNGATAGTFSTALTSDADALFEEGLVLTQSETCLFLRSPQDPKEAMFCVCSARIDLDAFKARAKQQLNAIAGAQ